MATSNFPMANMIRKLYDLGEDDEKFEPLILSDPNGNPIGRIKSNDGIIFANIRGEREVELSRALIEPRFNEFNTKNRPTNLKMATMIQYHPDLPVKVAFPPSGNLKNTLVEVVSNKEKKILKVVESEKAIHLKFFLNGKRLPKFPNEDLKIIESYENSELHPEMKAVQVVNATIDGMNKNYDFVVTNISNVDVIGHIPDKESVKIAVETVDRELGRLVEEAKERKYTVIVTADHGSVEQWLYPEGTIDTGHSKNRVPFIIISDVIDKQIIALKKGGSLVDIAPTILDLFNIEKPPEMTGHSLINWRNPDVSSHPSIDKILLIIVDGWGYREEKYGNLLAEFSTPIMDELQASYPFQPIEAAGEAVGLPSGTVGNSETGHLHIGAGRVVLSDRMRIAAAIKDGSFFSNKAFLEVVDHVKENDSSLHLIGIISFFSSHGSIEYLKALMKLANSKDVNEIYIHGLLGRRGERPYSGAIYVQELEDYAEKLTNEKQTCKLVSVIGRFWALDREYNWDRIEKTYNWLVNGQGNLVKNK